jgi:hypothetical protein
MGEDIVEIEENKGCPDDHGSRDDFEGPQRGRHGIGPGLDYIWWGEETMGIRLGLPRCSQREGCMERLGAPQFITRNQGSFIMNLLKRIIGIEVDKRPHEQDPDYLRVLSQTEHLEMKILGHVRQNDEPITQR